jgi:hypothetical protein
MADFYGSTFAAAKSGTNPQQMPGPGLVGAKRRTIVEQFTFAAQASGSQLFCGTLPIGASLESAFVTVSATTGTTTMSLGTKASPAKYSALAANTTPDVQVALGIKATAKDDPPLSSPEELWLTTAVGALPGAGSMTVEIHYRTAA